MRESDTYSRGFPNTIHAHGYGGRLRPRWNRRMRKKLWRLDCAFRAACHVRDARIAYEAKMQPEWDAFAAHVKQIDNMYHFLGGDNALLSDDGE